MLVTPITIDGNNHDNLLDVLNAWVANTNDPMLKIWVTDVSNENNGYPVFGNNYEPSCYNPTNVNITNATIKNDDVIRTRIEWEQEGSTSSWEVLYVAPQQSIEQGTIISVNSNPCELTDLPVGKVLDIYVRAKNDKGEVSGWSKSVRYIPEKLRWTEVVTSQPEGYNIDNDGNVYISSAEGLAWLSSVVNGLNGNHGSTIITNIYLMANIDLSAYRWTTIGRLNGFVLEGNNHTINGLYCNEYANHQGLFGDIDYCTIRNLRINNSTICGLLYNGTIAGEAGGTIENCIVDGEIYGVQYTGGLVGQSNGRTINVFNSAFIGMVDTRREITLPNCYNGFIGGITGEQYGAKIINTFVAAEIPTSDFSGIVAGSGSGLFSNLYALSYPTDLIITCNNLEENSSLFTGSNSTWALNTPPYINGAFRTDLLDALNAWVDANNSEGQYRHWVADTENKNGGYPIFAPAYMLTYMIDNKVYKVVTYEYGAKITPEPKPEGDYATFAWTDLPETMPAHDVVVHATYTTGIGELMVTGQQNVKIFSPNGKQLSGPQKGVNIIRMSDGTIRKVTIR